MIMYSETLLEHFQSPRNVGEMADASATASEENPVCGDRLQVWLCIEHGVVRRMTWQAEGCAPAIAAASVTSEIVRDMLLDEAEQVGRETIAEALGGLPARKAHAALLAVSALRKALTAYKSYSATRAE